MLLCQLLEQGSALRTIQFYLEFEINEQHFLNGLVIDIERLQNGKEKGKRTEENTIPFGELMGDSGNF